MDLIYVIGDPEGQVALLSKMIEKIQDNPSHMPFAANDKIVVMGNFIHPCEPSGQDMIDYLRCTKDILGDQMVVLRGKNEHKILKNRDNFHASDLGKNFIQSYRKSVTTFNKPIENKLMCSTLADDVHWLVKNTKKFYDADKYFVCPSGVDPSKKTLDDQNVNALMYINNRFIMSQKKYEKMIVHGTISGTKIDIKANRINVNTNCSKTRVLSCAVLDDNKGEVKEIITVGIS